MFGDKVVAGGIEICPGFFGYFLSGEGFDFIEVEEVTDLDFV